MLHGKCEVGLNSTQGWLYPDGSLLFSHQEHMNGLTIRQNVTGGFIEYH